MTDQNKYVLAIKHMAAHNKLSIEVDFNDLAHEAGEPQIAFLLPDAPVQVCIFKVRIKLYFFDLNLFFVF